MLCARTGADAGVSVFRNPSLILRRDGYFQGICFPDYHYDHVDHDSS